MEKMTFAESQAIEQTKGLIVYTGCIQNSHHLMETHSLFLDTSWDRRGTTVAIPYGVAFETISAGSAERLKRIQFPGIHSREEARNLGILFDGEILD